MTINFEGKCEACEAGRRRDGLAEIGEEVFIRGGKEGDTNHAFFQCPDCGSVWIQVSDRGGLGGNGTFYHLLTGRFY